MAVTDTVTDDIMSYCLLRPAEINLVRNGKVIFEVRDGHLLVARLEYEERVGRELRREDLDKRHLSQNSKEGLDKR